jgi:hypothetical protein
MLKNSKLLIDKNCPMCNAYGKCFQKVGLLDNETISHYQTIDDAIFSQIDAEKAKSEVALVNTITGETKYGIHAFLHILSHENSLLKWMFKQKLVIYLAQIVYRFISYNRQVMAGKYINPSERDCSPSFNLKYRLSYITLTAIATGFILNYFSFLIHAELGMTHTYYPEFLIAFGQIGWQFIAIHFIDKTKRLDYLGNMSTVSMIGGLLLIPLFLFNAIGELNLYQYLTYFGLVVFSMLIMHIKRSKNLGLPFLMTISWVSYRTIILVILIILTYQL